MHSYSEKTETARQQVKLKKFTIMQDVGGRQWPGERYHLMYTDWFSGYFLYKISGLTGAPEEYYTGGTWWGFEIQMAKHEEHSDSFEQL